jgi:lysophospholipase L1-like esterase
MRRLAKRLMLLVAASAATLAALEVSLRLVAPDATHATVWPPGLTQRLRPDPALLPGIDGETRIATSREGLRADPMPAGECLHILAVGGSTTECLYLDQTETWPALVEAALGAPAGGARRCVWVGNAGRSGLSSPHHVVTLETLLAQWPAIDVVVVLAGVNDLSWRLREDTTWQPPDLSDPAQKHMFVKRAFADHPDLTHTRPLHARSVLYRRVRQVARLLRGPTPEAAFAQDERGLIYAKWRAHRQGAPRLRETLPDLGPALDAYARNLEALVALARRHGVHLVLATQPVLWRRDLTPAEESRLWFGGVGDFQAEPGHEYYTAAALAAGMAAYNARLLEVCARAGPGTSCLPLAERLAGARDLYYDDCHFHEAGARRVAAEVTALLREVGIDGRRPP